MFLLRLIVWLGAVVLVLQPSPDGGREAPRVTLRNGAAHWWNPTEAPAADESFVAARGTLLPRDLHPSWSPPRR